MPWPADRGDGEKPESLLPSLSHRRQPAVTPAHLSPCCGSRFIFLPIKLLWVWFSITCNQKQLSVLATGTYYSLCPESSLLPIPCSASSPHLSSFTINSNVLGRPLRPPRQIMRQSHTPSPLGSPFCSTWHMSIMKCLSLPPC